MIFEQIKKLFMLLNLSNTFNIFKTVRPIFWNILKYNKFKIKFLLLMVTNALRVIIRDVICNVLHIVYTYCILVSGLK